MIVVHHPGASQPPAVISTAITSAAQIASLNITPDEFHGEWNYTIAPRTPVI